MQMLQAFELIDLAAEGMHVVSGSCSHALLLRPLLVETTRGIHGHQYY